MAVRPDPLRRLGTRTADDAPRSRFDARSLGGLHILKGGIFASALIRATANKNVSGAGAAVQVDFDVTDWDTTADDAGGHADFSMADLSNNRLVCRITGVYGVLAGIKYVADDRGTHADDCYLLLRRNGSDIAISTSQFIDDVSFATSLQVAAKIRLDAGDTITLHTGQRTGFTQAIADGSGEPFLAMTWEAMFSGAA